MKRSYFIEEQGVKIFYIDFTNLKTVPEIETVINESKSFIRRQPPKSVLTLANIAGMHFNSQIKEIFIEYVKGNAPYVLHSSITGVDGLRRVVFNGVLKLTGRDVRCLESVEHAKEYLSGKLLAAAVV
jgi:hypothetical protein